MRVLEDCRPDALPLDELIEAGQPMVLRGVARHWGLVQAGLRGAHEAMAYLRGYDNGRPVQYSYGGPEIAGRPFYNDDFTASELRGPARRTGRIAGWDRRPPG